VGFSFFPVSFLSFGAFLVSSFFAFTMTWVAFNYGRNDDGQWRKDGRRNGSGCGGVVDWIEVVVRE